MEPLRIVIDTNVLISGLCFGGLPAKILQMALAGKIKLCTSGGLLDEFKAVMRTKFPGREAAIADTLDELEFLWEVVPKEALPRISAISADPSDNKVLECAVGAQARCVVSGDKHLLDLRQFGGIPILSPSQFFLRFAP